MNKINNMNNDFYKSFYIDDINIISLGNLDEELGDELRAFKTQQINFPKKIFNSFINYYKKYLIKADMILYIPSNKNGSIMSYFADLFSKELNIEKCNNIKFKKAIKEQKHLNTLKERSENIKDAFEIINIEKLKNKNIILIDDVYASGETLKEVLSLLKKAEYEYLQCIVFCYRDYIFN